VEGEETRYKKKNPRDRVQVTGNKKVASLSGNNFLWKE
jgi:hypothetical protein